MPPLSPVETIEALLPGLIALTAILVVVIVFLLERYVSVGELPEKKSYRILIWFMTAALMVCGVDSILSLLFLLGIGDIIGEKASLVYYIILLILFSICIILIVFAMFITVKKILKRGR